MEQSKKIERVERTKEELLEDLHTQINFLIDECKEYDFGKLDYHKKIAITLRILLHNTQYSQSLCNQLTSAFVFNMPDFLDISSLHGKFEGEAQNNYVRSSVCIYNIQHYEASSMWAEPLPIRMNTSSKYRFYAFKSWWNMPVMLVHKDVLTRKDVVRLIANQDGGAHIDPSMDMVLAKLKRSTANPLKLSIEMKNGTIKTYWVQLDKMLSAAVRTIAEETLYMLEHYFVPTCEKYK